MIRKPIESPIEEIHRTRREISNRFHGDVYAIAEDAAARQSASGRPIWKPPIPPSAEQAENAALSASEPLDDKRMTSK